MKFLKHLVENPFITFTGLAALVHSTWSLGTLFSGLAPENNWMAWIGWVIPAFFIAFAMDIGQIDTSAKIRHKGLTWGRGIAFFTFSVATYYLQFLYIAHHMPALEIAAGISPFHLTTVTIARDAAIWALPTLLPLSTLLYTLSDDESEQNQEEHESDFAIEIVQPAIEILPEINLLEAENPTFIVACDCDWTREYSNADSSQRGLNAHQQKCKIYQGIAQMEFVEVSHDIQE